MWFLKLVVIKDCVVLCTKWDHLCAISIAFATFTSSDHMLSLRRHVVLFFVTV